MSDVGRMYIEYSRKRLCEEYPEKIHQCLERLTDDDIWWRAHETDNSIGNLILHLSGNVKQWIVSGIGERPDKRDRPKEFSERTKLPKSQLLALLDGVTKEADQVLQTFDAGRLLEVKHIQREETTFLDAISHVVEHFSGHLGQIIYITKLRAGKDLKFYNL